MSRRSKIQTSIQSAVEYWSRESTKTKQYRLAGMPTRTAGAAAVKEIGTLPYRAAYPGRHRRTIQYRPAVQTLPQGRPQCNRPRNHVGLDPRIQSPLSGDILDHPGAEGVCVHLREAVIPGDTRYLQPGVRPAGYSAGTGLIFCWAKLSAAQAYISVSRISTRRQSPAYTA